MHSVSEYTRVLYGMGIYIFEKHSQKSERWSGLEWGGMPGWWLFAGDVGRLAGGNGSNFGHNAEVEAHLPSILELKKKKSWVGGRDASNRITYNVFNATTNSSYVYHRRRRRCRSFLLSAGYKFRLVHICMWCAIYFISVAFLYLRAPVCVCMCSFSLF